VIPQHGPGHNSRNWICYGQRQGWSLVEALDVFCFQLTLLRQLLFFLLFTLALPLSGRGMLTHFSRNAISGWAAIFPIFERTHGRERHFPRFVFSVTLYRMAFSSSFRCLLFD
jgi:hypothetical protein